MAHHHQPYYGSPSYPPPLFAELEAPPRPPRAGMTSLDGGPIFEMSGEPMVTKKEEEQSKRPVQTIDPDQPVQANPWPFYLEVDQTTARHDAASASGADGLDTKEEESDAQPLANPWPYHGPPSSSDDGPSATIYLHNHRSDVGIAGPATKHTDHEPQGGGDVLLGGPSEPPEHQQQGKQHQREDGQPRHDLNSPADHQVGQESSPGSLYPAPLKTSRPQSSPTSQPNAYKPYSPPAGDVATTTTAPFKKTSQSLSGGSHSHLATALPYRAYRPPSSTTGHPSAAPPTPTPPPSTAPVSSAVIPTASSVSSQPPVPQSTATPPSSTASPQSAALLSIAPAFTVSCSTAPSSTSPPPTAPAASPVTATSSQAATAASPAQQYPTASSPTPTQPYRAPQSQPTNPPNPPTPVPTGSGSPPGGVPIAPTAAAASTVLAGQAASPAPVSASAVAGIPVFASPAPYHPAQYPLSPAAASLAQAVQVASPHPSSTSSPVSSPSAGFSPYGSPLPAPTAPSPGIGPPQPYYANIGHPQGPHFVPPPASSTAFPIPSAPTPYPASTQFTTPPPPPLTSSYHVPQPTYAPSPYQDQAIPPPQPPRPQFHHATTEPSQASQSPQSPPPYTCANAPRPEAHLPPTEQSSLYHLPPGPPISYHQHYYPAQPTYATQGGNLPHPPGSQNTYPPPLPPRPATAYGHQTQPFAGFGSGPQNAVTYPPPPRKQYNPTPATTPPRPSTTSSGGRLFSGSSALKWLDKTSTVLENKLDAVLQGPPGPPNRPMYAPAQPPRPPPGQYYPPQPIPGSYPGGNPGAPGSAQGPPPGAGWGR